MKKPRCWRTWKQSKESKKNCRQEEQTQAYHGCRVARQRCQRRGKTDMPSIRTLPYAERLRVSQLVALHTQTQDTTQIEISTTQTVSPVTLLSLPSIDMSPEFGLRRKQQAFADLKRLHRSVLNQGRRPCTWLPHLKMQHLLRGACSQSSSGLHEPNRGAREGGRIYDVEGESTCRLKLSLLGGSIAHQVHDNKTVDLTALRHPRVRHPGRESC